MALSRHPSSVLSLAAGFWASPHAPSPSLVLILQQIPGRIASNSERSGSSLLQTGHRPSAQKSASWLLGATEAPRSGYVASPGSSPSRPESDIPGEEIPHPAEDNLSDHAEVENRAANLWPAGIVGLSEIHSQIISPPENGAASSQTPSAQTEGRGRPGATVRARMPSVARSEPSGITGKIPASFQS